MAFARQRCYLLKKFLSKFGTPALSWQKPTSQNYLCAVQICSATSRLLVHERIADAFYARLKQRAESILIGDPSLPDTRLGPVTSKGQYTKIMDFIEALLFF